VRCVAGLLKNDCLSCSSAALRVDGSETNTWPQSDETNAKS
jgi:hypothetical protein